MGSKNELADCSILCKKLPRWSCTSVPKVLANNFRNHAAMKQLEWTRPVLSWAVWGHLCRWSFSGMQHMSFFPRHLHVHVLEYMILVVHLWTTVFVKHFELAFSNWFVRLQSAWKQTHRYWSAMHQVLPRGKMIYQPFRNIQERVTQAMSDCILYSIVHLRHWPRNNCSSWSRCPSEF